MSNSFVAVAIFTRLDFTRADKFAHNDTINILLFIHGNATPSNLISFGSYKHVNIWYQRLCSRNFNVEMCIHQLRSESKHSSKRSSMPSLYFGISWSRIDKRFWCQHFLIYLIRSLLHCNSINSIWYFVVPHPLKPTAAT